MVPMGGDGAQGKALAAGPEEELLLGQGYGCVLFVPQGKGALAVFRVEEAVPLTAFLGVAVGILGRYQKTGIDIEVGALCGERKKP